MTRDSTATPSRDAAYATTTAPEVAIVIPCYNHSHYLGECLASLAEQTYANWKAIVIDDVSPDHEQIAAVVEEFGDPRVRIVRHEKNRGLAAARNTGYRESGADYLYCVDADDKIAPDCIESLVRVLVADPSLDCAFGNAWMFGRIERVLEFHVPPDENQVLRLEDTIPGSGTMLRRQLWERLGGYDESEILRAGREDYEFNLRAFGSGCRAAHVPKPLYLYRHAQTSMAEACRLKDHVIAHYMLEKNRDVFGSETEGRQFLSRFYDRAARASHREHMHTRALRLALKAWRLDPSKLRFKAVMMALVPQPLFRAWRLGELRRRIPFARYPLAGAQRYRPFFLVGAGHSGGAVVGRMLGANSELFVAPEMPALAEAIQKYRRHSGRLSWPDLLQLTLAPLEFKLNAQALDLWLGPIVTFMFDVQVENRNLAAILDRLYRLWAKQSGASPLRWGDQSEITSVDDRLRLGDPLRSIGAGVPETLERLRRTFPDAQFIHVIRNGTDVVHTLLRGGYQRTLRGAAERWMHTTRQTREFAWRYPDQCTEVRYEDVLDDPTAVAQRLTRFLGVDFEQAMVDASSETPETSTSPSNDDTQYFSPEQQRELRELLARDLQELDYS